MSHYNYETIYDHKMCEIIEQALGFVFLKIFFSPYETCQDWSELLSLQMISQITGQTASNNEGIYWEVEYSVLHCKNNFNSEFIH